MPAVIEKPKKRPSRLLKKVATRAGRPLYALKVRTQMGLSREELKNLIGYSVRTIASWENGAEVTPSAKKQLTELDRLFEGLSGLIREECIPEWLKKNVEWFENRRPLEVIAEGRIDWIWEMIFSIADGVTA